MIARLIFCVVPASLPLGFGLLFHPFVAFAGFICVFMLGWEVTRPHKSRGEK